MGSENAFAHLDVPPQVGVHIKAAPGHKDASDEQAAKHRWEGENSTRQSRGFREFSPINPIDWY
jgi:hypothetical protein